MSSRRGTNLARPAIRPPQRSCAPLVEGGADRGASQTTPAEGRPYSGGGQRRAKAPVIIKQRGDRPHYYCALLLTGVRGFFLALRYSFVYSDL